jgi:predicted O-linked N-acetylglucosamine transferase (SPINDLY family)
MNNLGAVLGATGDLAEAARVFQSAIALEPTNAIAHKNLGSVMLAMRRYDEALTAFNESLRCDPENVEALIALANLYKDIGEVERAIECDRCAIALKPDHLLPADDLCYSIQYSRDNDAPAIARELAAWNARHAAPLAHLIQPHKNDRNPDRRRRIGYISPNVRDHCQALFMIPLLTHHDAKQFEITCFSDVSRPDHITERLKKLAHRWHDTADVLDARVADLIRENQIDILVDLSMHMTRNRLRVFAQKTAPIQVTWLAYPGSTGMKAIDYRLSDPYLDPPGEDESIYAEQTIRLPETFWCYDPLVDDLPVNSLPVLSGQPFTFGCLNHSIKLNDGVLKLWSRILREIPDSRLALLCDSGHLRDRVIEALSVDPHRIGLASRRPRRKYLELYHSIDLCLDTFPYNGHTTTLDAMWMGVPTVTLIGKTIVGRAAWSQLSNIGMTELAARDEDEYVQLAVEWSRDRSRLSQIRATLRDRMLASPLCDAARFARNIEHAYRSMWQSWCDRS